MSRATQIDPRMTKMRLNLIQRNPFFGCLALYLRLIEDKTCKTMWVDGTYWGYDPAFLDSISERETEGSGVHEVYHVALKHHTRRGNRDPDRWNEACDYAINPMVLDGGFRLPKDHLYDARFIGMSAEEIYDILKREGKPSKGGCCGVRVAASLNDKAALAAEEANWEIRVRQAVAAQKAAGHVPANIQRLFDAAKKPQLDPRAIMRRFIDSRASFDFSWRKPNKRLLHQGIIVPGQVPDGVSVFVWVVDTSGSMNDPALSVARAEVQAALDEGAIERLVIVYCDAHIQGHEEFYRGDLIKFKPLGGGGTRFSPALAWVKEHEPEAVGIIYFTDLDCKDFGEEPECPLLWLAYGNANEVRSRAAKVPFGEVIHIVAQ